MMRLITYIILSGSTLFTFACDQEELVGMEVPAEQVRGQALQSHRLQRGCVITSWQKEQYTEEAVEETLDQMKDLGCGWVSILSTWYQESEGSTEMSPLDTNMSGTPSLESLEHLILKIKEREMYPILKPHIDLENGEWRGSITFEDEGEWRDWFRNYIDFILIYARLAERHQLELFVLGTELKGTTHRQEWTDIIAQVRAVFGGALVYAANHDEYSNVTFWADLDFIGINAYFSLTEQLDPTPDQLDQAFNEIIEEMGAFAQAQQRDIIITEIGYQSFDGTNITPWGASEDVEDFGEQADCYQAALSAFFDQGWVAGIYFWHTHYDRYDWDGYAHTDKPAEGVLRDWYLKEESAE